MAYGCLLASPHFCIVFQYIYVCVCIRVKQLTDGIVNIESYV